MPKRPPVSTSYKKGQSGNLNGRPPKGYSITEMFRAMLSSKPEVKEALQNAILKKALQGDSPAQKLIWNYMDGMPKQGIEMTGVDGQPIEQSIKVTYV